jgi:hypothetical protein
MATLQSTVGDYFMLPEVLIAMKPKAAYTPVVGDLVVEDTTITNGFDRATTNENPMGIVVSTNGNPSNGTYTIARLKPGISQIRLEYIGANPALGQTMEAASVTGKGTVTMTTRDVVELDNTNGNLRVLAVDTTAKTVIVERVLRAGATLIDPS